MSLKVRATRDGWVEKTAVQPQIISKYNCAFIFLGNSSYNDSKSKVLFPEYELVTETEPDDDESDGSERSEEERLDEFKQFVQENDLLSEINGDDKELESLATLGKEALLADKQFRIFKKRISKEPKQVCMCSMCQEIFSPLFNLVML